MIVYYLLSRQYKPVGTTLGFGLWERKSFGEFEFRRLFRATFPVPKHLIYAKGGDAIIWLSKTKETDVFR